MTGEVVTASYMNGIRDALNFLLNKPHCELSQTVNQSIGTGFTGVNMGAITEDNDSMASLAGSRININTGGRYLVQLQVSFDNTAGTGRGVFIDKNLGTYMSSFTEQYNNADQTRMQNHRTLRFNAGDNVRAVVWTGTACTLATNSYGNSWVGATMLGT